MRAIEQVDEAAVRASQQPPVQTLQNGRRTLGIVGQRAQCPYNERNCHGRFQSLTADVSQGNQCTPAVGRDNLEEIAAYLLRRAVHAGNRQTGNHAGVSSGTRICCTSRADFTSSSIRACRSRSRNCSRAMVKIKARNSSVLRINATLKK